MYEVREVLRVWLGAGGAGPAPGLRRIAARSGVDRKTVRRYVEAAQAAGLRRSIRRSGSTTPWSGRWWPRCARPARPVMARRGRRWCRSRSRSARG